MQKGKPKRKRGKIQVKKIFSTINELEKSLLKSEQIDRELLTNVHSNQLKNQTLATEIIQLQTENTHLIKMLQFREEDVTSNAMPSCSTMSLVHLQYKYDELSANYNGLLKILEMRLSEIRLSHEENNKLKEELATLRVKMQDYEEQIVSLKMKVKEVKTRKNEKISKLKSECDTLKIVHNRLVELLDQQCEENNRMLNDQVRYSSPEQARLLQEIRKNNILTYENFQLHQEIEYLQTMLKIKPSKSTDSLSVNLKK